MELNKNNMRKIMFLIAFTLIFAVCIFNLDIVLKYVEKALSAITPFLAGGVMAFIINIPMNIVEKKLFNKAKKIKFINKIKRPVSLIISLIFIVGIISFAAGVVVPELYNTIMGISTNISKFLPKLYIFARKYINNDQVRNYIYELQKLDWFDILKNAMNWFTSGAGSVIFTTINVVGSIMSTTIDFIIGFIFCIYVLLQKETLSRQIKIVLKAYFKPIIFTNIIYVCKLTNRTFTKYVTGQCLDALILGVSFFIILTIAGIPYAMLIGVLIGFTALIPLVGTIIGCVISVVLILMVSPAKAVIFLIIFIILKEIDENITYPKIVGNSVGLPSIWVLVAVSVGGSLWGVVGMIVFIPIFSVIYTLFKQYTKKRLVKNK